ncbi:MAG: nucleotidyltransferase domain-containing protein, partial [Chitinispirillaceae bacterium]|nr:nucleotidyltransferase domain-containing protein [Chitinispirillaceae bacterium]
MEETLRLVKEVITEELRKWNLKVEEIILFGSRARGEEKVDSDWDFYVVVDKEIDFKTKREILKMIKRKLARHSIPNDILIQSKNIVEQRKNNLCYLT